MDKEIRLSAMNLLARREHSQQELYRKLANKGYESQAITQVLSSLSSEGLLSNERFTEAFIHSRLQRGAGPVKIAMELQQRGISDDLVNTHLDKRDKQWSRRACEVRAKRFGPSLPGDYKERSRQMRFLQYRGFTMDQIQHALGEEID